MTTPYLFMKHLIKQIMVELLKLIECVLHGSFQHLGGSTGSGLYLWETPAENGKDHMYAVV